MVPMAKRQTKSVPLPRMAFSRAGPKLLTRQLNEFSHLLDLPPEYQRFLRWRNGGTPALQYFTWTSRESGSDPVRIDRFLGFDSRSFEASRDQDTIWSILRFRHWFPKSAIPIAVVDD